MLFNGKDLCGWDVPANTEWVVAGDIVTITPSKERQTKRVCIFSKKQLAIFNCTILGLIAI
jgi:hypothetical protein